MRRIVPIILAAGLSTRMGRPKPLLDFDGHTALELVLSTCRRTSLAGAALDPLVIVLGHAAEQIRQQVHLGAAVVAVNPHPERGRSSSLRAGLERLPEDADGFLLFPVDCPLVRDETVRRLVASALAPHPEVRRIHVPTYGPERRRGHPILVDRALVPELAALGDDEPARVVVHRHADEVATVAVNDPGIVLDLDTPEDYERALVLYRNPGSPR